jgi:hypothetical protein
VVARILGSHRRRRSFVTRLWHWAVSGAALPAVAILGLATLVTAGQGWSSGVTNFGSALLALVLLVPPSVAVATLLGGGVLVVARRLPPKNSPHRWKAVLVASAAVFVAGTVGGVALLPFTSSDGLSALAALVHGLVFAVLPTTAAAVAWSRHAGRPGTTNPRPVDPLPGGTGAGHLSDALMNEWRASPPALDRRSRSARRAGSTARRTGHPGQPSPAYRSAASATALL